MNPILVVLKESKYEAYAKNNKFKNAFSKNKKYLEELSRCHKNQNNTIKKVIEKLNSLNIKYEIIELKKLKEIKNKNIVITIGGDGTFLTTSHFINDNTPILGINSDHNNSVGFFCAYNSKNIEKALDKLNKIEKNKYNRLQIKINNKRIKEYALNDVFIGNKNPALTSIIEIENNKPKCSGMLASTALGSSSWMNQMNGKKMPLNSFEIQYKLRDHKKSKPKITKKINAKNFTKNSAIYIDGGHLFYDIQFGDNIKIENGKPLTIMGKLKSKHH